LFVPLLERARMIQVPPARPILCAVAARITQAVSRGFAFAEMVVGLHYSADVARLEFRGVQLCSMLPFCFQRGFANIRPAGFAYVVDAETATRRTLSGCSVALVERIQGFVNQATRASLAVWQRRARPSMGFAVRFGVGAALRGMSLAIAFVGCVSGLSGLVRCHRWIVSMCLSIILRTSSAIDMPSRLASLVKYWRCGSVNEIICLVIGQVAMIPQGIQWQQRYGW
jgi:hypothetical protein